MYENTLLTNNVKIYKDRGVIEDTHKVLLTNKKRKHNSTNDSYCHRKCSTYRFVYTWALFCY